MMPRLALTCQSKGSHCQHHCWLPAKELRLVSPRVTSSAWRDRARNGKIRTAGKDNDETLAAQRGSICCLDTLSRPCSSWLAESPVQTRCPCGFPSARTRRRPCEKRIELGHTGDGRKKDRESGTIIAGCMFTGSLSAPVPVTL